MSPTPSFRRSSVLVSLPVLGLLLLGGVLAAFSGRSGWPLS